MAAKRGPLAQKALAVGNPAAYNTWLEKLGGTAGTPIKTFDDLLVALKKRHDDFHAAGSGGGHVFNLGHGISQFTPPDHVSALVKAVHEHSRVLLGSAG